MNEPPSQDIPSPENTLVTLGVDQTQNESNLLNQLTRNSQVKTGLHSIPQLSPGTIVYQSRFNPTYVQVSKPDAAEILGITIDEFENRRLSDNRCPQGFKDRENWMDPIRFRLSDIYAYSAAIMKSANPASTDPNLYRG